MKVIVIFNVDSASVVDVYTDEKKAKEDYSEDCYRFSYHNVNEEKYTEKSTMTNFKNGISFVKDDSYLDFFMIMDACDVKVQGKLIKNSIEAVNIIAEQYIEFNPNQNVIIVESSLEFPGCVCLIKETDYSDENDDSLEFNDFLSSKRIKII
jgi:hypothetical protein